MHGICMGTISSSSISKGLQTYVLQAATRPGACARARRCVRRGRAGFGAEGGRHGVGGGRRWRGGAAHRAVLWPGPCGMSEMAEKAAGKPGEAAREPWLACSCCACCACSQRTSISSSSSAARCDQAGVRAGVRGRGSRGGRGGAAFVPSFRHVGATRGATCGATRGATRGRAAVRMGWLHLRDGCDEARRRRLAAALLVGAEHRRRGGGGERGRVRGQGVRRSGGGGDADGHGQWAARVR